MLLSQGIVGLAVACIALVQSTLAFSGEATYYHAGLGNCGWQSEDSHFIVALSTQEYDNGAHCGQHIEVHYEGRTIDATVVDSCPGCSEHSIDLSPSAFEGLAAPDRGRIQVEWNYI